MELGLIWSLPAADRSALAWVLLRGSVPVAGRPQQDARGSPPAQPPSDKQQRQRQQQQRGGLGAHAGESQARQALELLYKGFEARAVAAYQDQAAAAQV